MLKIETARDFTRSITRGSVSPERAPFPFTSNSQRSFAALLETMGREEARNRGEEGKKRLVGFPKGIWAFRGEMEPISESSHRKWEEWRGKRGRKGKKVQILDR